MSFERLVKAAALGITDIECGQRNASTGSQQITPAEKPDFNLFPLKRDACILTEQPGTLVAAPPQTPGNFSQRDRSMTLSKQGPDFPDNRMILLNSLPAHFPSSLFKRTYFQRGFLFSKM